MEPDDRRNLVAGRLLTGVPRVVKFATEWLTVDMVRRQPQFPRRLRLHRTADDVGDVIPPAVPLPDGVTINVRAPERPRRPLSKAPANRLPEVRFLRSPPLGGGDGPPVVGHQKVVQSCPVSTI